MPASSGKAQLFTDTDYGGASAALEVGTYNLGDDTATVKNDTVSSLKVAYGYQVMLFTGRDCSGEGQIFNADRPSLPGYLNDTISSVRVEREPDPGAGQQQVIFVQPPSYG